MQDEDLASVGIAKNEDGLGGPFHPLNFVSITLHLISNHALAK